MNKTSGACFNIISVLISILTSSKKRFSIEAYLSCKNCKSLRCCFDVQICSELTDKALEYIATFKKLKILDLYYCRKMTNNSLVHLLHLQELQRIGVQVKACIEKFSKRVRINQNLSQEKQGNI